MYKIKITFDTGDSFHRERDIEEYLDIVFSNKNKAIKAMKDIEDHYTAYVFLHEEYNVDEKDKDKMMKKIKKCDWFVNGKYEDAWVGSIALENDNGERIEENVFWTGYFESLCAIDIIEDGLSKRFK